MWKIIIVEDEKPILQLINRLLSQHPSFEVIASFTSPQQALEQIPNLQCDVLLFDIEMPRINGLELAHKLVAAGIDVPVIFSTAYPQYALEAFQVQALDYVLKPMTPAIVSGIDERLSKYYGVKRKEVLPKLTIKLFGNPIVYLNDLNVVKWPTKISEELFYYFIIHTNVVCSKWRIIDDLWPNMDEKRATANLYNTIYRLRQLFSDLDVPITIDRLNDGYMFVMSDTIEVDWYSWKIHLEKYGDRLQEIEQTVITQLLLDYKGDLLETKGYLWAMPFQYQAQKQWDALSQLTDKQM